MNGERFGIFFEFNESASSGLLSGLWLVTLVWLYIMLPCVFISVEVSELSLVLWNSLKIRLKVLLGSLLIFLIFEFF